MAAPAVGQIVLLAGADEEEPLPALVLAVDAASNAVDVWAFRRDAVYRYDGVPYYPTLQDYGAGTDPRQAASAYHAYGTAAAELAWPNPSITPNPGS